MLRYFGFRGNLESGDCDRQTLVYVYKNAFFDELWVTPWQKSTRNREYIWSLCVCCDIFRLCFYFITKILSLSCVVFSYERHVDKFDIVKRFPQLWFKYSINWPEINSVKGESNLKPPGCMAHYGTVVITRFWGYRSERIFDSSCKMCSEFSLIFST